MAHELSQVRRPLRVRPAPRSARVTCAWLLTVAIPFVATPARAQTAVAPAPEASGTSGLADLDATTFSCAKAGLNAAAREARKAPSQGTYQFSYFRIANDAHHAAYEVHFKSNYPGEKELRYCVAIYCQQGWDPANTQATVSLLPAPRRAAGQAAIQAETAGDCNRHRHSPARRMNDGDPAQAQPR